MYAIPRSDLPAALAVFARAIAPGGTGLIFCQGKEAFYTKLHATFHGDQKPPFVTGEEILAVLEANGTAVDARPIRFTHRVPDEVLLKYLCKNVFEDRPMDYWLGRSDLKAILDAHATDGGHAFPQTVWLMRIPG
jgi:hypothetical protein